MSYGIDTIKLGFQIDHLDIDLIRWGHTSHAVVEEMEDKVYADIYHKKFTAPNGTVLTLKYVPKNYKGERFDMLFIEFSLPKLVLGCNHLDLTDLNGAFRIANKVIASIPGLPSLPDIQDAILYRIDLCANLNVGQENVTDYIQALSMGHHPHRTTKPYRHNGVIFSAHEVSTCVYDKFRECKCFEARGLLRYEIQMRTRWEISKQFGSSEPTLRQITRQMSHSLLLKDMRVLKVDNPIICNRSAVQVILFQKYKRVRAQNLLGYLEMRRTMTYDQLIAAGYTAQAISYYEKLLREAGISSLSINSKKTLPALTNLIGEEDTVKISYKVPSDTKTFRFDSTLSTTFSLPDTMTGRNMILQPHRWSTERPNAKPRAP